MVWPFFFLLQSECGSCLRVADGRIWHIEDSQGLGFQKSSHVLEFFLLGAEAHVDAGRGGVLLSAVERRGNNINDFKDFSPKKNGLGCR